MTPEQSKLVYELITNPPPGSKLAKAKEYGIDLTLLYENLKLTPTQRALKLVEGARSLQALRLAGEQHRAKR
jgi:hypothetical protein